ncbi:hypothetical protein DFH27DRAFT_480501 [Peziza echinospora]|nr:hypothetical protein DFH27DRAFT_480501 [Peziza echinospora]
MFNILKREKIAVYLPVSTSMEYRQAIATANYLYRYSRPPLVVTPTSVKQVQTIVKEARQLNIPITIRNGGHSYAGFSTTDKGILLDLARMKKVTLDMQPGNETVTMAGGARWADVYRTLVYGHHDGYVINGGRCPGVGVSGFTLGGGLGPFTRSFGMGVDSLLDATIVTANGDVVTVGANSDPDSIYGQLFWALCGAGCGNFGVVVSLTSRVEKLKSKEVVSGRYTWFPDTCDPESKAEFEAAMAIFYTTEWPDELTIDSSWVCELGKPIGVRFTSYYNGKKSDFDETIRNSPLPLSLSKQIIRRSLEEYSSLFLHETLVTQWKEEVERSIPANQSYSAYSSFVFKFEKSAIENAISKIQSEMAIFRKKFTGEKGLLQVTFIHSGGKAADRKRNHTAYRWRDGTFHTYILVEWFEKWLSEEMDGFCQRFAATLRPLSIGGKAAYINFPDRKLSCKSYGDAYYGRNYTKLQEIKGIWDKDNYFRYSQSIQLKADVLDAVQKERPDLEEGAVGGGEIRNIDDANAGYWADQLAHSLQWEGYAPRPFRR